MPNNTTVCLASGWGTGTRHAYKVMDLIAADDPDYTIHLGDVYYTGDLPEMDKYFLGADDWHRGKIKTFGLNGNHEMYSGGKGYFKKVLSAFQQDWSWFCLENDFWRIVAVDTGYLCKTFPFFELLISTDLPEKNVSWLRDVVFADPKDSRPVILLSHHQPYSAFEGGNGKVRNKVNSFADRVAIWFWGHEHRLSLYGQNGSDGMLFQGRCIGHGGMPVEVGETYKPAKASQFGLVAYDARVNPAVELPRIGYCGYSRLTFENGDLTISYFSESETLTGEDHVLLLTEKWRSDKAKATLVDIIEPSPRKLNVVDGGKLSAAALRKPGGAEAP